MITPEIKDTLTKLRFELNMLNTLNCTVHLYQGDYSADQDWAREATEGSTILYLDHLKNKVEPLFTQLGTQLQAAGEIDAAAAAADGHSGAARRWYQGRFLTGVMW